MGISTGSLAAATVALSPDVATLIPFAAEVCLVAFRLGLCVRKTAQQLASIKEDQRPSPWASMKVRMNEAEMQAILGSFKEEVVSWNRRIRILTKSVCSKYRPINCHILADPALILLLLAGYDL